MTTNIHDKNKCVISSDSRWSVDLDNSCLLFVDDADFEKMVVTKDFAIITAGSSKLIDDWKKWAKTDISADRPPVELTKANGETMYISICLILKPSIVLYDSHIGTIVTPHARFSGSGREAANMCWTQNRCALQAIETAKTVDYYTGGSVKFANLDSNTTNLGSDLVTYDELHSMMLGRGLIMDKSIGKIISLDDYEAKDDISRGIKNGSLVASAPTGDSASPWNVEQEKSLDSAIHILRRLVASREESSI